MRSLCGHIQAPTMRLKVDNGAPGGGGGEFYTFPTQVYHTFYAYTLYTARGGAES